MVRVLLTGASGLSGRSILRRLASLDDNNEVLGLAYSRATGSLRKCDLHNGDEFASIVESFKPEVIIHCAAERRPDVSENDHEATLKLNVEVTTRIAKMAEEKGIFLLHLSTDYVFDGTSPPYKPNDATNPLQFYGKSKRLSEEAVLNNNKRATVLRVPILYSNDSENISNLDESSVTTLVKLIDGQQRKVEHWASRYPLLVDDLSKIIRLIVVKEREAPGSFAGIWHLRGREVLTKYEMVKIMFEVINRARQQDGNSNLLDFDGLITPDAAPPSGAPRPKDTRLDDSQLLTRLNISEDDQQIFTPFHQAIAKIVLTPGVIKI